MNRSPAIVLQPVFDYLDELIREQGHILFMVFAYGALAVIVWILCGGLLRKSKGNPVPPVIFIYLPGRPAPPLETFYPFAPLRDDCPSHDERHWD